MHGEKQDTRCISTPNYPTSNDQAIMILSRGGNDSWIFRAEADVVNDDRKARAWCSARVAMCSSGLYRRTAIWPLC
jgi:hypothetical protein